MSHLIPDSANHRPPKPSLFARLRQHIHQLRTSEQGSATIEFVLAVPVIMSIFTASIESGVMMTRYIMLEQSVDMVMRNLRLGKYPNPTSALLKAEICKGTIIMNNCTRDISIELQPISITAWNFPSNSLGCVDREQKLEPTLTFNPGAAHQIMLVRVCVVQDVMFPTTGIGLGLPKDNLGGYGLVATSAFVNEP